MANQFLYDSVMIVSTSFLIGSAILIFRSKEFKDALSDFNKKESENLSETVSESINVIDCAEPNINETTFEPSLVSIFGNMSSVKVNFEKPRRNSIEITELSTKCRTESRREKMKFMQISKDEVIKKIVLAKEGLTTGLIWESA